MSKIRLTYVSCRTWKRFSVKINPIEKQQLTFDGTFLHNITRNKWRKVKSLVRLNLFIKLDVLYSIKVQGSKTF